MTTNLPLRAARVIRAPAAPAPAPEPKAQAVDWINIDLETLPEDIRAHYYAYRQALDHANKLRAIFEEEANEAFDVGASNKLAFGYKFGKLSAAIVPKSRPTSGRGAQSLASLAKAR